MTELELKSVEASIQKPPTVVEVRTVSAIPPQSQISPELLELQNRHRIRLLLCWFLMIALGYSVHRCYSLIFFYLEHGHQISEGLLRWLCGATIAQLAVMLGVFVRAVWQHSNKTPKKCGKVSQSTA